MTAAPEAAASARGAPGGRRKAWIEIFHLAVLSSLAIAHPILEVIGGTPEYFVALRAGRVEASVLLVASLGVPTVLMAMATVVAGSVSPHLRRAVHLVLVGLLAAAVCVPALHRAEFAFPHLIAVPVGVTFAAGYHRARPVRDLVTFLGLGLVFVPLVFVTSLAGEEVFFRGRMAGAVPEARARPSPFVTRPYPVIFLLLDELPLGLLLDRDGRINERRYPGFAELARLSTWYRDATGSSESTIVALPSMLTGRQVVVIAPPTFDFHPNNLFLLLSKTHDIETTEYWTNLSPRAPAPRKPKEEAKSRPVVVATVLGDAMKLGSRLLFPPPRARAAVGPRHERELPIPWLKPFEEGPENFRRFLSSLEVSSRPFVRFCHLMLPHSPYQRFPSGQRYTTGLENLAETGRLPSEARAERLLQRAALQVGFADRLVARFIARLRDTGLIDRAVVVVASDHGIAFRPNIPHRVVKPETLDEVAPIPLFIRVPGEQGGAIVDAPIQGIDVLPTIADALGAEIPWPVQGRVARTVDPTAPRRRVITDRGVAITEFDDRFMARRAAQRHAESIGDGPWADVWRIGPLRELVFRDAATLPVAGASDVTVRWGVEADLASAGPSAEFLPALVSVELTPLTRANLVLILNDRVAASVAFTGDRVGTVGVLLPPELFRKGGNRLKFLLEAPGTGGRFLVPREEQKRRE